MKSPLRHYRCVLRYASKRHWHQRPQRICLESGQRSQHKSTDVQEAAGTGAEHTASAGLPAAVRFNAAAGPLPAVLPELGRHKATAPARCIPNYHPAQQMSAWRWVASLGSSKTPVSPETSTGHRLPHAPSLHSLRISRTHMRLVIHRHASRVPLRRRIGILNEGTGFPNSTYACMGISAARGFGQVASEQLPSRRFFCAPGAHVHTLFLTM